MIHPGKLTLRLALGGGIFIYLAGDLCVWHGPLRRQLDRACGSGPDAQSAAVADRVVARVYGRPITLSQLERALREDLWLKGKSIEALNATDRKAAREAALDGLIDHELLRAKVGENAAAFKVSDEAIDQRLDRFRARFESSDAMKGAMKSQGIRCEQDLRGRLAARIQQEQYLESKIGLLVRISDEEARQWFDVNAKSLALPERVEVRHIFLPTLDHPSDEAKAKLEVVLADLTKNRRGFAALAKEYSEDPATKDHGGELGWMTRSRLPEDFSAPVFALELHQPTLVRTRLGWHLVEVTGRKPAEARAFEQAKPEILAALEAVKRRDVTREFRRALRQSEAANIKLSDNALEE
jgi:parvulin-like peptidyl-prolyl isomerase